MIIACPNCQTKYNLPDDKIPPGGRKVKCSKCQHTFKAAPPPASPEEEVEVLLDEERTAPPPSTDASSEFDDAFNEAVASDQEDDLPDSDLSDSDLDDAFGSDEDEAESAIADEEDLFGGDLADEGEEDDAGLMADEPEDEEEDLLSKGDDGLYDGGDQDDFAQDAYEDDEEEESMFPLSGEDDFSLDDKPKRGKKGKRGKKKGNPLLLIFLLLILLLVAAIVTFNLGLWNEKDFIKDPPIIELGFEPPLKIPFVRGPQQQAQTPVEPGQSPTEKIKYIQPVDFRQYIITNEKAGPIFVVEGKALNKFTTPKERIKVMVTLFDGQGNVLTSAEQLCGNTLSLFQLQVQSEQEIMDALNSQAGIYANNTYIKPGETTPFMVVFFNPPESVEEYQIKIVDARDPAQ